ncbi:myelin transcription factor 1-like protein isoform X3 [Myxocyprinus asiaticus]|uniref:myelin transcription factor 1-like protein isoform X3 n=1 Tax=Myxocyprinus asiaticus TaxID=70543 RepID=UPI0022236FD8|nr:myelin transcription factor 1-like protein isoform X3 [Myxocyprinus asiaticus]
MRLVVPIILSVAVAGFHSVISASLQLHERTESPEERDELEFEAAHVEDEESLGVTHMEANVEESEEIEVLDEKETEDDEKETLTDTTGENADSDESVEHSEQAEENVESVEDITADQSIEYYDS